MIISMIAAAGAAAITYNVLDVIENKIAAKHAAKKAAKAAAAQQQEEPTEEPAPAPTYTEPVQPPFQAQSVPVVDPGTDPTVGEQIANAIASVQDAIVNTDEDDADKDDDTEAEEPDNADGYDTQFSFMVGDHVTVSNPVTVTGSRFGGNPETRYTITSIDFNTGHIKISKGPKKRVFELNPEEAGLKKI